MCQAVVEPIADDQLVALFETVHELLGRIALLESRVAALEERISKRHETRV